MSAMLEPDRHDLVRDRQGKLWEFDFLRGLWRCRESNTAMSWPLLVASTHINIIYRAEEQR